MVHVTDQAINRLKSIEKKTRQSDQILRLAVSMSGDVGLVLSAPREGDEIVEEDGAPLLAIGEKMSAFLGQATVDCDETENGPKLILKRTAK